MVSSNAMLLCVDVGDMRGGFALGRLGITGLLAVADEVLEVLYGRHGQMTSQWTVRPWRTADAVFGAMEGVGSQAVQRLKWKL